jgi:adenylosuccinate lyase
MTLDERAIARNMARYGPFAASERVLMALVQAGADRQEAHEWIREASLEAWDLVQAGAEENPLPDLLARHDQITSYLAPAHTHRLLDAAAHVGTAPERALALAQEIRDSLAS